MVWCHPIFMLIRRSYPDTEYFKASSDLTPQPVAANNLLHPPLVTGGVTHGSRSLRNPAAVAHPLHARRRWPIPSTPDRSGRYVPPPPDGLSKPARTAVLGASVAPTP